MNKQNDHLAELSKAVSEYTNAINHISMLAKRLVDNDLELDVEIILRESIPFHKKDMFAKRNADMGFNPDMLVNSIFDGHGLQYKCTPQQKPEEKIGLRQDNMPRDIALIMLESINNWYKRRLAECKADLFRLVNQMQNESLQKEQILLP